MISVGFVVVAIAASHAQGFCVGNWEEFQNSCFYFSTDSKTWIDASNTCRAHSAELTIITSPEKNEFIGSNVQTKKGNYWLDGTDAFSEGNWEWASTGEPFEYTSWFPKEPNNSNNNEDCLMTSDAYNRTWNDGKCSDSFKFICERRKHDSQPVIG